MAKERAHKAAKTRAENAERERQENERLARETEGGRAAKRKALENAVWNSIKGGRGNIQHETEVDMDEDNSGRRKHKAHIILDSDEFEIDGSDGSELIDNARKSLKSTVPSNGEDSDSASGSGGEAEDDDDDDEDDDDQDVPDLLPIIKSLERRNCNSDSAKDLFDIPDDDVEISSAPFSFPQSRRQNLRVFDDENGTSQAASRKSRKRSHTVTFSDGALHKALIYSRSDEKNISPMPLRKKAKVKGRRQEAFEAERPQIKTADNQKIHDASKQRPSFSSQSVKQWSAEVQLKPEVIPSGKKRKLKTQTFVLQAIIHHAIEEATDDILLKINWPEENNRLRYGKRLILKACLDDNILGTYTEALVEEVKQRIKTDSEFTKGLCDLVVDRISGIRGPAKTEAAKCLPIYQLGLGEHCKERVESLLQDLRFHMLGTWGGDTGNEWQPDRKSAFRNPAVIDTIKAAFFSSSRAIGYRCIDKFSSSVAGAPNEKEIPIPLLTLNLTGLYSCLYEFKTGRKENLEFNGATFGNINAAFVNILEKLQKAHPLKFHQMMHDLFKLVVDTKSSVDGEIENDAFNIIDF